MAETAPSPAEETAPEPETDTEADSGAPEPEVMDDDVDISDPPGIMELWFGTTPEVFLGLSVILMGLGAFMAGQALARGWRPMGQVIPYMLLLGLMDRFLVFALFQGELFTLWGYLLDSSLLCAIASFAYRLTRAHQMVTQYPWLYVRAGLLTWRERLNA